MRSVTWLAAAISVAWPTRPNPVTSVHACTWPAGSARIASAAARLSAVIDRTAAWTAASGARPALMAVPTMPVPMAFVRNSTSPGFAPAFESTRAGSISPVTA